MTSTTFSQNGTTNGQADDTRHSIPSPSGKLSSRVDDRHNSASASIEAKATPEPTYHPAGRAVLDFTPLEPDWLRLVQSAFDHVCTGGGCPLPTLLEETRKRGIPDEAVRYVIQSEEEHGVDSNHLHCERNAQGVGFVWWSTAEGCLASVNELFAELSESDSCDAGQTKGPNSDFSESGYLSTKLRERGEQLGSADAVVLDACHTLNKRFRDGQSVSIHSLGRLVRRYHADVLAGRTVNSVISHLLSAGILRRKSVRGTPQVRLMQPFGGSQRQPSRWAVLTPHWELERLLRVCDKCCGRGFNHPSHVALESTVQAFMAAAYMTTKRDVRRSISKLVRAGVLIQCKDKGCPALRLSNEAHLVMRGDFETIDEARAKGLTTGYTPEQDKDAHSVNTPAVTAAEAHSGLQKALQYLTGVLRRKAA